MFKVIGLGGIGSNLIEPLARFLSGRRDVDIVLIDGDMYEFGNGNRQKFDRLANKAIVVTEMMMRKFPTIHFRARAEYITSDNVIANIREGDLVFLAVDNHKTRRVVSDRCSELDNITLISGGNDYIDGNVIYYKREGGKDVTRSLTDLCPEIANPQDDIAGQGCEADPQLLFTNMQAAVLMLAVYRKHEAGTMKHEQVYFDIETLNMRPSPENL